MTPSLTCTYAINRFGFLNRTARDYLAPLLGVPAETMTAGRMTHDLRGLRLRGLIERIPRIHRYRVTKQGLRTAVFFTRAYNRFIRTGLAELNDPASATSLSRVFDKPETEMDRLAARSRLAA